MGDKVITLAPHQVWDPGKGCFFVGLEATKERHCGQVVHKDKCGRKIVITEFA
jgi:hypothetical protein